MVYRRRGIFFSNFKQTFLTKHYILSRSKHISGNSNKKSTPTLSYKSEEAVGQKPPNDEGKMFTFMYFIILH